MNVIRHTEAGFPQRWRELLAASSLFDPVIEGRTRTILEAVQARGDTAVLELTERFDGARLRADQLAITRAELVTASLKADAALRAAVAEADKSIAAFARKTLRKIGR